MNVIYHIVPALNWEKYSDQSIYEADSLQTEGFIHLSQKDQVSRTVQRYYHNVPNLLLLHVDVDKLMHELIYESATNNELFPHLYGPLNKNAIVQIDQLT